MSEAPGASIILVARDRRADLAAALDSLAGQAPAFETIVVDDGSRDGTAELLRERGVVALRHEEALGPGAARNAAAARARGDVLVFLDSDCRAQPGWLAAMLAPLADPAVGAVGGAEELPPDADARGRLFHFLLTSPLTTGRLRGGAGARAGRYRPRTFALAVRREVFERAGGFRALRHGEDIDFGLRVARLGLRLVHAPEARVWHRRRRTVGGFLRQLFAMGRARATLLRMDRGHLEPVYLLPPLLLPGLPALLWAAPRPTALAAALWLAAVGVAAAVALRAPAALLTAPLLFAGQQAAYGCGFWVGLVRPFREGA